jgi:hypothetical protein
LLANSSFDHFPFKVSLNPFSRACGCCAVSMSVGLLTLPYNSAADAHNLLTFPAANRRTDLAALLSRRVNLKENSMNKPLIAALAAAIAFAALPTLASPTSTSTNDQPIGMQVAQSSDSQAPAPATTMPADQGSSSSQSSDEDK